MRALIALLLMLLWPSWSGFAQIVSTGHRGTGTSSPPPIGNLLHWIQTNNGVPTIPVVVGNYVVIIFDHVGTGGVSFTSSLGNSYPLVGCLTYGCVYAGFVTNAGSDSITGGAGFIYTVTAWTGINVSTPIDVMVGDGSDATFACPGTSTPLTVTTTAANDIVFAYMGTTNGNVTMGMAGSAGYGVFYTSPLVGTFINGWGSGYQQPIAGTSDSLTWSCTLTGSPTNINAYYGIIALEV